MQVHISENQVEKVVFLKPTDVLVFNMGTCEHAGAENNSSTPWVAVHVGLHRTLHATTTNRPWQDRGRSNKGKAGIKRG